MKRWIQHFYQLNRLNWLMVWLLLCCSIILLFPAGLMKGAVSQWRKNGIPAAREQFLRLARPDAFERNPVADQKAA